MEEKFGVETTKNSFILSSTGEKIQATIVVKICIRSKKKGFFFSNILSCVFFFSSFQRPPLGGSGPEFMLELIGGCMPILPPMGGAGLPVEEGGTPPDTPPVMLGGSEGRSSNLS